jgi:hypothetical protein
MLWTPVNDHECLGQLTAYVAGELGRADLRELAGHFAGTADVVLWIRTLRQRNDAGELGEGPKLLCDVPQRVRLPAPDPNCVERALLYCALAEHIEPAPRRQLVTIETDRGRHTLPLEEGRAVLLDPEETANTLDAGLWAMRNGPVSPVRLVFEPKGPLAGIEVVGPGELSPLAPEEIGELVSWVARIAECPAVRRAGEGGLERVRHAGALLADALRRRVPHRLLVANSAALWFLLTCAEEAAVLWGPVGVAWVRVLRGALERLGLRPGPRPRRNDRSDCDCAPGREEDEGSGTVRTTPLGADAPAADARPTDASGPAEQRPATGAEVGARIASLAPSRPTGAAPRADVGARIGALAPSRPAGSRQTRTGVPLSELFARRPKSPSRGFSLNDAIRVAGRLGLQVGQAVLASQAGPAAGLVPGGMGATGLPFAPAAGAGPAATGLGGAAGFAVPSELNVRAQGSARLW